MALGRAGSRLRATWRVEQHGVEQRERADERLPPRDGETIEGNASTGVLAPGDSDVASGQWTLPAGATPDSVTVVAITVRDGEATRIERSVTLGRFRG